MKIQLIKPYHFGCERTCRPFSQECKFSPVLKALGENTVYSHVTKIKAEIRSLDALAAAAAALGLELVIGQKTHKAYFSGSTCDHALKVRGKANAYEIGVIDEGNGTFRLAWDDYQGGNGLVDVVGPGCQKLLDQYTLQAAQQAAIQQGWSSQMSNNELIIFHPSGGTLTVNPTGIEANGFSGCGCTEASEVISQAIGKKVDVQLKQEYYQVEQQIKIQGE